MGVGAEAHFALSSLVGAVAIVTIGLAVDGRLESIVTIVVVALLVAAVVFVVLVPAV